MLPSEATLGHAGLVMTLQIERMRMVDNRIVHISFLEAKHQHLIGPHLILTPVDLGIRQYLPASRDIAELLSE